MDVQPNHPGLTFQETQIWALIILIKITAGASPNVLFSKINHRLIHELTT
jgi:hypothetical protein